MPALSPFTPPPLAALDALAAPLRAYFDPRFVGLEEVDASRPALYVGNHTIYGVIDVPLLGVELYRRGVYVRGLGDRLHFEVPLWRDFLGRLGVVEGSRAICDALMAAGEPVMVFPGGGREVCRRRGEVHSLIWKDRIGFARQAIAHGYPIVPFAQVGVDFAYDVVVDADDVRRSPLGALLRRVGVWEGLLRRGEALPPLARGLGPTLVPRPERLYFAVGRAIEVDHLRGRADEAAAAWELRRSVAGAIEGLVAGLEAARAAERERWPAWRRALCGAGRA